MIATRSAFEFLSSLVQRAHAALVGRWRGFGRNESRVLVCSCPTSTCFPHCSSWRDPPCLQELCGRNRRGGQSLVLAHELLVQRFPRRGREDAQALLRKSPIDLQPLQHAIQRTQHG